MKKPKFDGCSGMMSAFWRTILRKPPPWEACCDEHDTDYYLGGTKQDRLESDRRLWKCVKKMGYPGWAQIMYYAVRIGGHPISPFKTSRWGFGGKWTPFYKKEKEISHEN
ncbi:MAG: hypothetical protein ACFFDN_13640 [Candidatus Hodarchaeota archaeon]